MEAPTIIVVGVILALLSALSIILLKLSSKEYPKEEVIRPKFEAGKVSYPHCTDEAEKPKRRYKKKRKKKPTVANDAQVEKRSVGRPRKSQ
jgi:hypothetical protein